MSCPPRAHPIPDRALPLASEEADRIRPYLSDESSAMTGSAERVFYAEHAGHLAAVLEAASREGKKVSVSAAGTSITGARVPLSGGWVLATERMRHLDHRFCPVPDRFTEIRHRDLSFYLDAESRHAIVPAGLTLQELNGALARFALVYPPDPTEMTAMVGGTVATNASGARSFHYRPTRAWVRGLDLVLPWGEFLRIRRGECRIREGMITIAGEERTIKAPIPSRYPVFSSKNAAGLYLARGMDLVDLFIGSEGILGVVAAVHLELVAAPQDLLTTVAFFDSMEDALDFVESGRSNAPLSMEFFDRRALSFLRDSFPAIPQDAAAAVLFEFEYRRTGNHNPYPPGGVLDPWLALLQEHRSTGTWSVTGSDVAGIKAFRHALPEAVNMYVRARVGKLGTDMAVPPAHFRTMVAAYDEADACGVKTVFFGHIGDSHLHLNFLPEDERELALARKKYLELARRAVELGGTISAEHGVGKKTIVDEAGNTVPYLEVMLGVEGLRAIHAVKAAFDPGFILNPGNMVPEEYR